MDSDEGAYVPVTDFLDALAEANSPSSSVMSEALELASAVVNIINEYNIRDISPNGLAEMSRRLYHAGAIGLEEHALLSHQPELCSRFDADTPGYQRVYSDPNTPRDMLAEWEWLLAELEKNRCHLISYRYIQSIVDLLQSFEPFEENDSE